MTAVIVVVVAVLAAAPPLGAYLATALSGRPSSLDRWFAPVERPLYAGLGIDPAAPMGYRAWIRALLSTNLALGAAAFALFLLQGWLPLNPDGVPGMRWDLALHTAASFVTNTNQQHYSGQAQLSYLGQLAGVVTLQVVSPAVGMAVLLAVLRGSMGGSGRVDASGDRDLGNYHADVTRTVVRVLLPLATALALFLTWQGVPSTLGGAVVVHPIDAPAAQTIPVGPVAPLVAIKQVGTNGGGWYGPNAAAPLENPTPASNVAEMIAIALIPVASVWMTGRMTEPRFGRMMFGVMGASSAALAVASIAAERATNAAFAGLVAAGPNWEGKEARFGVDASALWSTLTTQTSSGSVDAMLDSSNPLGGLVSLVGILLNETFGGIGVGVVNFLVFVWLTAFVAGLMVGRTPEVFGRKLGTTEIRWVALTLLSSAALVLVPTAVAVSIGAAGPPGFHALTRALYEYASATANNGSGFEGLADGTVWWNLSATPCLVLGRFVPLVAPLAVAGSLAAGRAAPRGAGSLSVSSATFGVTTLAIVGITTLLTYLPELALGPLAEQWVGVTP